MSRTVCRPSSSWTVASSALRARLASCMHAGKDTSAALVRATGMSARAGREIERLSRILHLHPKAGELLDQGHITSTHALALGGLPAEAVEELLGQAGHRTPEEFEALARAKRIREQGKDSRSRQFAARTLRFFAADLDCVGFRGVLPPVEAAELRGVLEALSEATYRATHPERARIAGTNETDTRDQRLADALVELARGAQVIVVPDASTEAGSERSPSAGRPPDKGTAARHTTQSDLAHGNEDPPDMPAERTAVAPGESQGLRRSAQRSGRGFVQPVVVAVVDLNTLQAELVPGGPIDPLSAADLIGRSDVFALIRNHTTNEVLNFGRNRRLASALQRLVLSVHWKGCAIDGCGAAPNRTEVHHIIEWSKGGRTDINAMVPLCDPHHTHLHDNNLSLAHLPSGRFGLFDRASPRLAKSRAP